MGTAMSIAYQTIWNVPKHYTQLACDLCGAAPAAPFLAARSGFYSRCPSCGFVYANPRHPDPAQYNGAHNHALQDFYLSKQYAPRHQRKYARLLRRFARYRRTNRILEIGCSTGGFCWRARHMGWQATGVEPVAAVADVGLERGLDIRCAMFEETALPADTFDVVFSNAVLEHVASPTRVLREAWRILRPGGVVYADTVNIDSYTWRWLGARWKLIDPRAHLGLFTPETLRRLCLDTRYRVLTLTSHGVRFRANEDGKLRGLARWSEEVRKLPWALAARWTLQGESIAVLAQKPG
jgi:SAM-dependent methyltransferase